MRIYRDRAPVSLGLASLLLSACSLTGPLDGYATGDAPDASSPQDAASEETSAPECKAGFTDCDGNAANGCETDLQNDADHCGSCSIKCNSDFAEAACVSGKCAIVSCEPNHKDCDQKASTGCEVDISSSSAHCGECNRPCQIQHATPVCNNSSCALDSCSEGWGDCNDTLGDGCETNVKADSLVHCGACDQPCNAVANSTPVCTTGSCGFVCKPGYDDCDKQAGNGCEVNIFTTQTNCGACGVSCSSINGTPACQGGNCSITCKPGFDDCNADVKDGCEANLQSDASNCGQCDAPCPTVPGATSTCTTSTCGFTCLAGFGNCDNDGTTGCETDLLTTATDCGTCGHSCGGAACAGGFCEPTTLSSSLTSPFGIAVDSNYVYWTDDVDGAVYRQVRDGTLVPDKIASPGSAGVAIAVDNARVYFSTSSSIRSYTKVSAVETELAAGQVNVRSIVLSATSVYWVTGGTTGMDGTVMRVDFNGSNLTEIAADQPQPAGIALYGTAVYWTNQGTWTGPDYNNDGSIWKSGSSTAFQSPLPRPSGMGVDGATIVWANRQTGQLFRKDTSGGAPVFLLAGQTFGEDLVIKDGTAYWTYPGATPSTGAVMRFPLAAGTARAVAPAQDSPRRVAVDSTHVYWTIAGAGEGDGAVYRTVK